MAGQPNDVWSNLLELLRTAQERAQSDDLMQASISFSQDETSISVIASLQVKKKTTEAT